ncbi:carbon-nitrogen hydrolase family protein [Aquisalimonas sp.]|uniref:carbon-nitrogen hydrolase family protein n=1 Tax=unclassified Aquisalimonas TaxID=2644645 RepID=UPI0025BC4C27|nr:carbon-nitrogen hydrolase family protein [Aquisalimonas sp.]
MTNNSLHSGTRVAAVQMASGPLVEGNLHEATRLVGMAAEAGAEFVVLPENVAIMGMDEFAKLNHVETDAGGPIQDCFAGLARRHGVWLVAGTIPMRGDDPRRVRAACLVYDDRGERVARYDKLHLFDVDVDGESAYRESATFEPGEQVVTVGTPFGCMGVAVCYDLRFPEQFRAMVDRGAEFFVLPSAFTARTGEAHWRPLLQARAIENQCHIIASGQGGYHVNGRETHGDSLIVDPWGRIQDSLARGSGVVLGALDRQRLADVRTRFPSLRHRRLSCADAVQAPAAGSTAAKAANNEA